MATTTKTKFATIADLQTYVDTLTKASSAPKTQKAPEKKPSDAEKKQAQFLEDSKKELNKRIQTKKDFVKSAPLFKKPAFYLDQLSPVLNVELVVLYQNRKTLNDLPQERRFKLFDESNNHLVTFKYGVQGNAEGGVKSGVIELVFIDPKQEITEYITMQLAALQTILSGSGDANNPTLVRLEVEFGWNHNPDHTPDGIKNWDKIAFTNKIIGVVETVKTTFNNLGLPETTITCTAENTSTLVFRGASPMEIFGPFPATTLCFEELNRLFRLVFQKLKEKYDSANTQKAIWQLGFYLNNKGVGEKKFIIDVIEAAGKYYGSIFDGLKATTHINRAVIESTINHSNLTTNPKFIDKYDLMAEVVGLTTTVSSSKDTTKKINISKKVLTYGDTVTAKIAVEPTTTKSEVSLYHTIYRSILDGELTLPSKDRLFTNYFTKAGTVIHNCFKIHPFYLYMYVTNYIHTQLNKNNIEDQQNTYLEFWDYNADLKNALMPREYFNAIRDNKPYIFRKAQDGKPEDEAYFINTMDVAITLGEKWETFLGKVFGKMFVKYSPIEKKDVTKGLQFELNDTEKADIKTKGFVPLPIQSNVQYFNGKTARKNIDIWIQALELREKYLTETVQKTATPVSARSTSGAAGQGTTGNVSGGLSTTQERTADIISTDPSIKSTRKLIHDARTQRNLIDEDKYYLVNFLTIKIPSSLTFNVDIGSQMIAQTYSYRVGGEYEGMFNPGEPTCWDVNFPDVISLTLERDMFNASRSVAAAARISGSTDRGQYFIANQAQSRIEQLLNEATEIAQGKVHEKNPNAPLRNSLPTNELSQIKDKLNEILSLDPSAKLASTSPARTAAYPINVTIQDYQHSRIYSGDYYNMLERKREVQNIRANLMVSGIMATGEIEVLGDSTFAFSHCTSYWIFIKVLNLDGSLSFFSGVYKINGISHEISAGKFTTKFQIMSDVCSDQTISLEYANQMKTIIYGSDKQKAYMGE